MRLCSSAHTACLRLRPASRGKGVGDWTLARAMVPNLIRCTTLCTSIRCLLCLYGPVPLDRGPVYV